MSIWLGAKSLTMDRNVISNSQMPDGDIYGGIKVNETKMALLLAAARAFASPTDITAQTVQPIRPVPPIGILPPNQVPAMRQFSVSIGTADSAIGYAWILTPSQRSDLEGHWFTPGTRVEIFASPATGYVFTHWTFTNLSTGTVTNDKREIMAFTIRGHMIIEAHFARQSPVRPVPPIGILPISQKVK